MKKRSDIAGGALAMLMMIAGGNALAGNGVKVEHPGASNTFVRVTGEGRYLLLPVQESSADDAVSLLVDGKLDKTFNVRLAKTRTDYYVPVDLGAYKGKDVLLDIITAQGRNSVREAKEDACWDNITLSDTFDTANREKYRPAYHHTPLYGWMNDPNGMFYKDGVWHLYYQWNPYGSKWQNMTWGHSTSKDLLKWERHPAAIEPDGLGMIFSGSCAIDREGSAGFGKDAVIAMYTSAAASQVQSLAASHDNGATFGKYPGNPVLTLESEARDPNMFWDAENHQWVLTLAHALEHEMLFFTSPDMKTWTLQGAFGKGQGAQDGVWECPDLFSLPVGLPGEKGYRENGEKWVLLCNLNPGGPFGGSATQYFIGDFDGKTFKSDTDAVGNVPVKWLDFGKDHYAAVSFSDAPGDRRTVLGWMSNWQYANDVPTMQYRSANTLPRDLGIFRATDGELYVASMPSPEVDALRGAIAKKVGRTTLGKKGTEYRIPALCEIEMEVDPAKAAKVDIVLSNAAGEKVTMTYNVVDKTFSMDRTRSGLTDFSKDFPAVTTAPAFTADGKLALRIFIDNSSIEAFGNGGRFVMTNLVFPDKPYTHLTLGSQGGKAVVSNLKIYNINL